MAIHVRELTDEERVKIDRLVRSRTAPVRLALRAKIVRLSGEGMSVPAIARELGLCEPATRRWVCRFNARGLEGLEDQPRSGRPATYTEFNRSRVIAKARGAPPKARGAPPKPDGGEVPPSCHWTLNQLTRELNKEGVSIKRSQIRRILLAEHVKWQKPRSWLESDDPEFAEKRGSSSASTRTRPRAA